MSHRIIIFQDLFKKIFLAFLSIVTLVIISGCSPALKNTERKNIGIAETVRMASEAYENGQYSESVNLFSLAVQQEEHPFLLNNLGVAYLGCNQPQEAVKVFERAVLLMPEVASFHSNLGTAFCALSNFADAEKQFFAALRIDPQNSEALVGVALVSILQNKPEQGLRFLSQVIPKDNFSQEVHYNTALCLYNMGLSKDAEIILKNYVDLNQDDASAHNALGVVLLKNNKLIEAKLCLDKAIDLDGKNGIYYYNRGNILKEQKIYKSAIDDYSRAIVFQPDMAEVYINRGELRYLLDEPTDACLDFQQACALGSCVRLQQYQDAGKCSSGIWK
jgi:tetratricopeptide (TPR) repeat protein